MDLIRSIGKWFCIGVVGLLAFGFVAMVATMLGENIAQRRRRKRFRQYEVFRTAEDGSVVILDQELETRLQAIGSFTTRVFRGERDIIWKSPNGLTCDFAPFELTFSIDPDNIGPDVQTFELWDRYRSNHQAHMENFRTRLIELHRELEPQLTPEQALALVREVSIEVRQEGFGESADHELAAGFQLELDEEHGHNLIYHPETDSFGDWEEGYCR